MNLLKDFGGNPKKKAIKDDKKPPKAEKKKRKDSANKIARPDLKPIKIPEDPIDLTQDSVASKGSNLKRKVRERNESVDA